MNELSVSDGEGARAKDGMGSSGSPGSPGSRASDEGTGSSESVSSSSVSETSDAAEPPAASMNPEGVAAGVQSASDAPDVAPRLLEPVIQPDLESAPAADGSQPRATVPEPEPEPKPEPISDVTPAVTQPVESAPPSQPLPAEPATREEIVRAHLTVRPKDGLAHLELIALLKQKGDVEATRSAYDALLKIFPLCAQQWIDAITFEFAQKDTRKAEALFARSLRSVLSIELWHLYLDYVRKTNIITLGDDGARKVVGKAYEFVLNHVGMDRNAGQIWQDYIAFLKSADARDKAEEEAKVENLRKVYHRALVLPLSTVEQIWRDYDQFENALNKLAAKKVLGEMSPSYMTARSAARELRPIADALPKTAVPLVPEASPGQDAKWIALMEWEMKNPLEMDDADALHQRIMFAAKQAFIWAYLCPKVWYHVASYLLKSGRSDEAKQTLNDGFTANPQSVLLGLALAEYHEHNKAISEAYAVFQKLSDTIASMISSSETTRAPENGISSTVKVEGENAGSAEVKATLRTKMMKETLSFVTIQHLNVARRGESIKSARTVFGKARRNANVTWHVYHASAMMEYHNSKDPGVATKVFELGMKQFAQEPEYVEHYLSFLLNTNDIINGRALFERGVTEIPGPPSARIWDLLLRYECNHGDLATFQALEQRALQAFPDTSERLAYLQRHRYTGLDHIAELTFQGGDLEAEVRLPKHEPEPASISLKRGASEEAAQRGFSPVPPPRVARDADAASSIAMPQSHATKRARQGQGRNGVSPLQTIRQASPILRSMKPLPLPAPVRRPEERLYAEIPEAIVFFLSILPNARTFNGPLLRTDDLIDVFRTHALLPPGGHGARMYGR